MRLNLRYKINGAILITFMFIVIIYIGIEVPFHQRRSETIMKKIETLLHTLVERDREQLANEIFGGLERALKIRLDQMLEVEGILTISVFDNAGKQLVSSGHHPDSTVLSKSDINEIESGIRFRQQQWIGKEVMTYMRGIQVIGERIGFIRIYYSLEDFMNEERLSTLLFGGSLAAILFIMLGLLNMIMSRTIIRPIISLNEIMGQMQTDNIEQHIDIKSKDEIGDLSKTFNQMSKALSSSYKEIEDHRAQLRQARNYLRNIINSMPSMLVGVDKDGKVTQWNPKAEEVTGIAADKALGLALSDVFPQMAFDMGNVQQAIRDKEPKKHESVLWQIGDMKKFIDITIYPLITNRIEGSVIRIDDVTERKQTQEALQESEEKYRLVVDYANDGIVIIQDGIIKFANPKIIEISGYSPHELSTTPFIDFIEEEDKAMVLDRHTSRMEGDETTDHYSFRIRNRSGDLLQIDANIVLITWEGRPATLNFLRDITEQKKVEEQLKQAQKMEAIGNLAGGVAHDFNNLLQAIQGYAELLLIDKDKSKQFQRELKEISGAARRAGELTQQLLTFSRKVESTLRPVDINQEIVKIHALISRTIPKMIDIRLDLSPDLNTVNADPGQIEQVLMNLAVNARDAMPEGGKLIIKTENVNLGKQYRKTHLVPKTGEYVLLRISDTGQGIDREALDHIFEPFYTTKGVGKGTGLGLAMVYGIVKNHNGFINCLSSPGNGTTFNIYLPSIESFQIPMEGERVEAPMGGSETILLVDDDKIIRDLGSEILEKYGYKILLAENGEEALEVYQKERERINLVILDLIMPGMGGRKCLDALLSMDPNAKIVIASGYSPNTNIEETMQAGAKGFIRKPYSLDHMLNEIRRVLEKD